MVASAGPATAIKHTAADVAFMQGMIGHHAQALDMTALLKTRTTRDDMKLLALGTESRRPEGLRLLGGCREEGARRRRADLALHRPGAPHAGLANGGGMGRRGRPGRGV